MHVTPKNLALVEKKIRDLNRIGFVNKIKYAI